MEFTALDMGRLSRQLKESEGLRLEAYRCPAGALTIGYGHNCDASPVEGVNKVGDSISQDQANILLAMDIGRSIAQVRKELPWVEDLTAPRQAVLFDMAFNMGIGSAATGKGLLGFKNTLALIKRGQFEEAANGMLASKWAKQVKGRANRLAEQMKTGTWQ